MLRIKKILYQIENNLQDVLDEQTALGKNLWKLLIGQHPADIAMLLARLDDSIQRQFFAKLPSELWANVFRKLAPPTQARLLTQVAMDDAATILQGMQVDELTDLFDELSDQQLEIYLKLLQTNQRNQIISLLSFNPRSAGGRMHSDVITLQKDLTVRRCIELLQRLGPQKLLLERLFVTNKDNILIGYITLDKLVLNKPDTPLASIISPNELHVYVDEDQEEVANQMHHYDLMSAPVVDSKNHFLGVITADDVFEIIKEEGSEDVYRMSGLPAVEHGYLSTPIWTLVWRRSMWLVSLLALQSLSGFILSGYAKMLGEHAIFTFFLTMLIGTGGNAGNQSATLVIRGLTTKEISRRNARRVLGREFFMALAISSLLFVISFIRVYWTSSSLLVSVAVSLSLSLIVIVSVMLGACIPLLLERLNIDPAHSAAPFLATIMDVVGILIYASLFSRLIGS